MKWLTVTVLLIIWKPIYGSIVAINESRFSTLPPLYALEEWAACRAPGDVYCAVDAALTARAPSPALALLQEYSKQSLKHYNRSIIHRGVCVSRCGALEEGRWDAAAQRCLNLTLLKYGVEAEVQSVDYCTSDSPARTGSARALAALCTLLAALACLATVLHALAAKCGRPEGNKYLLAFSLKRNWEILTYDRSQPRTDDRMKDVACIEGIRFVGMQCVIFSHVMLIYIYSYVDNPHFVENMYDQFGWKAVLNSPIWLQAFFSLSGFLTAYTILISSARSPITLYKCCVGVINRWIRLTPVAVFALWFTIAWFPRLGAGPQWAWLVTREADDCAERWWYHALYVHNHLPLGKFCMGHTWYLAADMQLHVFGLLLMLALVRWRRAAGPALAALGAGAALAAGAVVYCRDLAPIITGQAPEVLRTWFAGSQILSLLYLPAWMNLPGYVGGMATAFLLHHIQEEGTVKLHQIKWFNVLFHSSLTLAGGVVLAGTVFLSDRAPPLWARALYAAADRPLVAVCFNVFLLGCFTRCRSLFRSALEWRGFHTLGRLSYCVFLIHFIVLRLTLAANTQLNHASILSLMSLQITSSTLSYLAAIPLCLLVELPALQLWKAATGELPRDPTPPPPTPAPALPAPSPDVKPFDLLQNVRRRLDLV